MHPITDTVFVLSLKSKTIFSSCPALTNFIYLQIFDLDESIETATTFTRSFSATTSSGWTSGSAAGTSKAKLSTEETKRECTATASATTATKVGFSQCYFKMFNRGLK
jgi:hypothetical protein